MANKKKTRNNQKHENKSGITPLFIDTIWYQILPVIFIVLALLLLISFFFEKHTGFLGPLLNDILFGLFSFGAFLIPICLIRQTFTWKKDVAANRLISNIVYSALTIVFISVFFHSLPKVWSADLVKTLNVPLLFKEGTNLHGGGAVGGLLSSLLSMIIGEIPTFIISLAVLIVFVIFMLGLTPMKIAELISVAIKNKKQARKEALIKRAEERERLEKEEAKEEKNSIKHKNIDAVVDEDDTSDTAEQESDENIEINDEETLAKMSGELNLEEIFINKENLELSKKMLSDENTEEQAVDISLTASSSESPVVDETKNENSDDANDKEEKEYQFPPISFLTKDSTTKTDVSDELVVTGNKLVRTLESFGVKTTVVNISRGPSVTRYELQPQIGVKVKSIGNLVDDIALHLAAKGAVRIEAPIPGKSAVGIEIPNQDSSMVRLRGLIENEQFTNTESKLTTAVGEDVAGNPVYMNIAAMPHLLIAGATGMGKSVCINSLIMSILYKARPDEVKLILIDPKKVELNMYNGIPHLIVPVVSDPKKSAGALRWAVNEMERRFQLMDECGARDLKGYNEIANIDFEHEKLPQIVIIIDELADLMMTAPKDVEDSICRIAQKARAAGMHLIIGTQRPSVDVITGLIKANIPSRIAFTVASQIDSRTIIDIAGAEKLCGKGDMLYAPVGISKPMRVQGSFVSTAEVERVCEFVKSQFDAAYDAEVAKSIEAEADKCGIKGVGKDKPDSNDTQTSTDGADEMLMSAIEIAVDAGDNGISTSMLQRRLSLGYARAGRLIDTMEKMGIVGGFEGSKPRKVLMTREQYMEFKLGGKTANAESEDV